MFLAVDDFPNHNTYRVFHRPKTDYFIIEPMIKFKYGIIVDSNLI